MFHNTTSVLLPPCTRLIHGRNLLSLVEMQTVTEVGEEALVNRLLGQIRDAGMARGLRVSGSELARYFEASEVVLVIRLGSRSGDLWRCGHRQDGESPVLEHAELTSEQADDYFTVPGSDWLLTQEPATTDNERWNLMLNGGRARPAPVTVVERAMKVTRTQPLVRLLSAGLPFVGDSTGRLFVANPSPRIATAAGLRSLVTVARQAGPAILAQYEVRALEGRVEAEARARLARELHDGVIQSLIAVQMRVQALQRQAPDAVLLAELQFIHQHLREPITVLRELMEHLRLPQLDAHELVDHVKGLVETFARVTGLEAAFQGEPARVELSRRRCREVALMVQEALVNIQRHSSARSVKVRWQGREWGYELRVADDGRGFPFTGRFTLEELDTLAQGPRVIKERVKALGGTMTIESAPSRGSELVINIPRHGAPARG